MSSGLRATASIETRISPLPACGSSRSVTSGGDESALIRAPRIRCGSLPTRHVQPGDNERVSTAEPQFVRLDDVSAFELARGVSGRPGFGEAAMVNLLRLQPRAGGR